VSVATFADRDSPARRSHASSNTSATDFASFSSVAIVALAPRCARGSGPRSGRLDGRQSKQESCVAVQDRANVVFGDTRTEAHSAMGRIRDYTELRPGLGGGRSELPRSAAPTSTIVVFGRTWRCRKLTLRRDDARVVKLRRSVFRLSATGRVKPD
jgi:hypothetical protein